MQHITHKFGRQCIYDLTAASLLIPESAQLTHVPCRAHLGAGVSPGDTLRAARYQVYAIGECYGYPDYPPERVAQIPYRGFVECCVIDQSLH